MNENIIEALQIITTEPGQVREVRIPKAGKQGTISGYYDDLDKMAEDLGRANGKFEGIYFTLNPVNPDLLARAANRIKAYSKDTTNDMGILRRDWFFFDCDPIRPAGISSTAGEKKAAMKMALTLKQYLLDRGWPLPWICDSGNGYHDVYRINLPNDDESRKLIEAVLKAMAAALDTDIVKIDQKVFNAARIVKAWGTKACKGDSTDSRPHRYSEAFAPPDPIVAVTKEQLQEIAGAIVVKEKPSANTGQFSTSKGDWTEEKVDELLWAPLRDAGTHVGGPSREEWVKDGVAHKALKWQHDCLSNTDHHKPDAFTMLEDGWVHHHCSHDSCALITALGWRNAWSALTNKPYPRLLVGFEFDEVQPDEEVSFVSKIKVVQADDMAVVEDDVATPEAVITFLNDSQPKMKYPELRFPYEALPEGPFKELVDKACEGGLSAGLVAPAIMGLVSCLPFADDHEGVRVNMFVTLLAMVGAGKDTAMDRALSVLGMREASQVMYYTPVGERSISMAIGDKSGGKGQPRVAGPRTAVFVTYELAETLNKAKGETSGVFQALQFYFDHNNKTYFDNRTQTTQTVNCRLSWITGLPVGDLELDTDEYVRAFGEGSTGGLESRMIFGFAEERFDRRRSRNWAPNPSDWSTNEVKDDFHVRTLDSLVGRMCLRKVSGFDPGVEAQYLDWLPTKDMSGRDTYHVLKVAVVTAMIQDHKNITQSDWDFATAFMMWQYEIKNVFRAGRAKQTTAGQFNDTIMREVEKRTATLKAKPKTTKSGKVVKEKDECDKLQTRYYIRWKVMANAGRWHLKGLDTQKAIDALVRGGYLCYESLGTVNERTGKEEFNEIWVRLVSNAPNSP